MKLGLATLLTAALAACSSAPADKSDWERRQESRLPPKEAAPVLPPYPRAADLIEFEVAATQTFRYFVDAASISVADDVVRYSLVARSDTANDNVSYEGMRCESGEVRQYALGRDGTWVSQSQAWQKIAQRSQYMLYRDFFCPMRAPIANPRDGVTALRRGGHSSVKGHQLDIPRGF